MIENMLRRFEDFVWRGRRFVWYPEDIRIVRRSRVMSEDLTPWVWEDAAVVDDDTPVEPLDLAICWRDKCGKPVPHDDDVGLCPKCVAELRAL